MFGVSFTELMLIGMVALIVVGPQRLPGMMANVGKWSNKLRRMLFDVRQQSGIDDILRAEGITGGLNEIRALRNAVRGNVSSLTQALTNPRPSAGASSTTAAAKGAPAPIAQTPLAVESDPYANVPYDRTREYPDEGCDSYGAIADDLWAASHRPVAPEPAPGSASTAAVEGTDLAVAAPQAVEMTDLAVAATQAVEVTDPAVAATQAVDVTDLATAHTAGVTEVAVAATQTVDVTEVAVAATQSVVTVTETQTTTTTQVTVSRAENEADAPPVEVDSAASAPAEAAHETALASKEQTASAQVT